MRVKDADGTIINNIKRAQNGALVVNDSSQYSKFKQERENQLKIKQLESQVKELSELVMRLLNK